MIALAIDARMILSSGIGTVIANVTRRLVTRNREWKFQIAGDTEVLRRFTWADASNVDLVEYRAPIYSIREQTAFPGAKLRASQILWSPNYNTPVSWRGKMIVTIHDLAHLVLPEMRNSLAKQLFARFMFAEVRRRADFIAFVSQFSAGEFHRLVDKPRGHEAIIHCGVDESWFQVGHTASTHPYILFVGSVKPHKNLPRLLDAFTLIQKEIPHNLLIVGRKEGLITGDDAVLRRIEQFGGRVAFTGYVSDPELKRVFAGADALVQPSLYEGFGLPPVEAMAAGCPALVSRTASLPEVCQDAALYCDPLDVTDIAAKMVRILTDQALRETLKGRGMARARELNWEACTSGYERAIKTLLG
jgi:glycosyltransferase involved in cell wall biosynthesis